MHDLCSLCGKETFNSVELEQLFLKYIVIVTIKEITHDLLPLPQDSCVKEKEIIFVKQNRNFLLVVFLKQIICFCEVRY